MLRGSGGHLDNTTRQVRAQPTGLDATGAMCENHTMDKQTLGRRIVRAREASGRTQSELADTLGLDRSALSRLENGERKLDVAELMALCEALDVPLAHLVGEEPQTVASRRRESASDGGSSWSMDVALQLMSHDASTLQRMGLLEAPTARPTLRTPRSHDEAEHAARAVREVLGLEDGPIYDLGVVAERLGLFCYVSADGEGDGAFVIVDSSSPELGVAVISGDAPAGRRRMTLAHEIGHWVFGDAYDSGATWDERMIFSFVIHLLMPRNAAIIAWNEHDTWDTRHRALRLAAEFRLSWSATLNQLMTIGLIDSAQRESLGRAVPKHGDYVRLRLTIVDELEPPYLPPAWSAAAVEGFVDERLSLDRTLRILRGTITAEELPALRARTKDDLRESFVGHGG